MVSLAAQLIMSTRDIINLLREIRDSPEELRCTIELLNQLQGNLEGVKWLVEEQNSCVDLPSLIAPISSALRLCEGKITLVDQCLKRFKRDLDHGSSIRRQWASFKHVLKKGEMNRLQDQLREATIHLQLALIINTGGIG